MADSFIDILNGSGKLGNIPILTLDERWYGLISEENKTDKIRFWEKKVNDILKKQGKNVNDLKELKKIKSKLMKNIVDNMELDDDLTLKKMMNDQKLILEIKQKIERIEDENYLIPGELRKANDNLMAETIKLCYDIIDVNKQDIEVLDKWIEATRLKLKNNIMIKQDKEDTNTRIYTYLHDIFGPETMGLIDEFKEK